MSILRATQRALDQLIYFSALLLASVLAVSSVSELVSRHQFSHLVSAEIGKLSSVFIQSIRVMTVQEPEVLTYLKAELLAEADLGNLGDSDKHGENEDGNSYGKYVVDLMAESPEGQNFETRSDFIEWKIGEIEETLQKRRDSVASLNLQMSDELEDKANRIGELEAGLSMVRSLSMSGTGSLREIDGLLYAGGAELNARNAENVPHRAILSWTGGMPMRDDIDGIFSSYENLRSDHLLSIAIISCATAGALIAGLRRQKQFALRTISLGVAAGVVTYFALRGGKSVMLLESAGFGASVFNPYGSAFVGLVSGLFTERAFSLLSDFVDSTADRVREVAGIKGSAKAGGD